MHRAILALAVSSFLTPAVARAERLPIRAYTTADGLAHDTVNRIVRDSRGFLWFATDDGLSRFDGYTFTNYSVEQGLPHRRVMDFLETRNGELWVATFGGLVRFRPDGVQSERVVYANAAGSTTPMFATVVPADEDPGARAVLKLLESRDGTIWGGTRKGLVRLDRTVGRLELRHVPIGMPDEYSEQKYVKDLVEDEHESLWIAAPSGLYRRWRDGTAARYDVPDLFRRARALSQSRDYYHLHDLLKDHQGRIWAGSRALGFFRLKADGSRREPVVVGHYGYPDPFASWIEEMLETSDGRFWAASNLGLLELSPSEPLRGSLIIHNRSHGLIHESVRALAEDVNGNLWIGTGAAGAMKVARSGFVTYGRADGIGQGDAVLEDASGQLYVLAHVFRTGLLGQFKSASPEDEYELPQFGRFDGRRFEWFMPGKPFWLGWVIERSVLRTRNNEWWLAGGTGLFRYAPHPTFIGLKTAKPIRVFTEKDGLPELQVYRMFEDSRGDVWFSIISRTNGLFRWSRATDTLRNMAVTEGFPRVEDELPRAFGEDRDGNVWIGLNNGVARYTNGSFAFFKMANGLPLGAIVDIHADASRRLWLASSRSGLIRLDEPAADPPAVTRFTTAEGLSGNSIAVITEDLQGRLYLATGRGIDQLDPATGAVRQFTNEDGLPAGVTICASRDRTGALWFGTYTGLSRFVPAPTVPLTPPTILVTGVTVAGRPWPISAVGETSVTLPALHSGDQHLQIDFASLRFAVGERLRYQYRLEGSDEDWSPPTLRRSISFASFSPGMYRLLVRAVNADGLTSPQPAVVAFTVLPPLWLRWWFLSLLALALGTAVLALHRYRLARVLELERVRTRIATDLHDDVGANLTRIAILSEAARQQRRGGASNLDGPLSSIADIARESVATMSDIVWAISPERDTLSDIVRRMRDHAEEVFESRDIRLILELPDVVPPSRLGVDVRRDFYLIFKEAVNNAARHSGCSNVAIALRADGARLRLEVTDDGNGFDPRDHADGNGLANMKRRATRLGATLEVLTEPGVGTTVRLTIVPADWRPTRTTPTRKGR